jgi:hypothetical protein
MGLGESVLKPGLSRSLRPSSTVTDSPGNGQVHVARVLREQKKLLDGWDKPDTPSYVRDQTPPKTKGEITTGALRNGFPTSVR